jgi:hypothetical protein
MQCGLSGHSWETNEISLWAGRLRHNANALWGFYAFAVTPKYGSAPFDLIRSGGHAVLYPQGMEARANAFTPLNFFSPLSNPCSLAFSQLCFVAILPLALSTALQTERPHIHHNLMEWILLVSANLWFSFTEIAWIG